MLLQQVLSTTLVAATTAALILFARRRRIKTQLDQLPLLTLGPNDLGVTAVISPVGASILKLAVPAADGKPVDVVLGYERASSYAVGARGRLPKVARRRLALLRHCQPRHPRPVRHPAEGPGPPRRRPCRRSARVRRAAAAPTAANRLARAGARGGYADPPADRQLELKPRRKIPRHAPSYPIRSRAAAARGHALLWIRGGPRGKQDRPGGELPAAQAPAARGLRQRRGAAAGGRARRSGPRRGRRCLSQPSRTPPLGSF